MIRRWAKNWLLSRGIVLSRPPGNLMIGPVRLRLARDRGLQVRLAVDGGAATGAWTRELLALYPASNVVCVEPRDSAQSSLHALRSEHGGVHIVQTLLGDVDGEADFHEHDDQSSMLGNSRDMPFGRTQRLPVTTLDRLVMRLGLGWPDMIKLDLQGAELLCLAGAAECLAHATSVILEVSFIPFQAGQPLIADVLTFMKEKGFRCYDVLALWHRPLDGALAQGDLLFLSERSELLRDPRWSRESPWS